MDFDFYKQFLSVRWYNLFFWLVITDPACQYINTKQQCYVMDPSCPTDAYTEETKNHETIIFACSVIGGLLVVLIIAAVIFIRNHKRTQGSNKHEASKYRLHRGNFMQNALLICLIYFFALKTWSILCQMWIWRHIMASVSFTTRRSKQQRINSSDARAYATLFQRIVH